ncbi:hypothetical protein ACFXDJ_15445 [Streptomyces sp. NPDC059443]|uniref:hypothetical protein n=1 Tax=unclassified Streptomyces TaxID=2593676 RepID=UPI003677BA74
MTTEGWTIRAEGLAAISPHRKANVLRFGDYYTTTLHIPPGPHHAGLDLGAPQ